METSTIFLLFWSFAWMVIALVLHSANKALARKGVEVDEQSKVLKHRSALLEQALIAVVTDEQLYKYIRHDVNKFVKGLRL